jgi:serine/threonine-protein kinase
VRLDFDDATGLPGFDSYLIWRDGVELEQVREGVPPFVIRNVDPNTEHCYYVTALVVTHVSPAAKPVPACVTAEGN